jgi:hypothetical protein
VRQIARRLLPLHTWEVRELRPDPLSRVLVTRILSRCSGASDIASINVWARAVAAVPQPAGRRRPARADDPTGMAFGAP